MKINITQPCPACKGHKNQLHPSWAQLFEQREHEPELSAADYFLEQGILTMSERPSLVIDCIKCKGKGEIPTWVTLERFLELVRLTGLGLYKFFGGAPL